MQYKHHYPEAIEDLELILKEIKTNGLTEIQKSNLEKVLRHCIDTKTRHITGTDVYKELKNIFTKKNAWSKQFKEFEDKLNSIYQIYD